MTRSYLPISLPAGGATSTPLADTVVMPAFGLDSSTVPDDPAALEFATTLGFTARLPGDRLSAPPVRNPRPEELAELDATGAYPTFESGRGWVMPVERLAPVLDAYFDRSLRLIDPQTALFGADDFFLTNELEYPKAIGAIAGRGGAFIGVGEQLPFVYAAWQGAAHAYAIDVCARVPLGFTPLYGALLCMARSRAELLSLLVGRPLPPLSKPLSGDEDTPLEIARMISGIGRNPFFTEMMTETFVKEIAGRGPLVDNSPTAKMIRTWIHQFGDAFDQNRNEWPLSMLGLHDAAGRGGVLSSEQAFRQERQLFLQGRVTGVASDLTGRGLALIASDLRLRQLELGAIYFSNAEDYILTEAGDQMEYGKPAERDIAVRRLRSFYHNLAALPGSEQALVISAMSINHTYVDPLVAHLERAIPIGESEHEAARATILLHPLRQAIAESFGSGNVSGRLHYVLRSSKRQSLYSDQLAQAIDAVAVMWRGEPLTPSVVRQRLLQECPAFRDGFKPFEQEMFLRNLEGLGVLKGE